MSDEAPSPFAGATPVASLAHADGSVTLVVPSVPAQRLASWRATLPGLTTDHAGLADTLRRTSEDLGALRIFDPDHPDVPILARRAAGRAVPRKGTFAPDRQTARAPRCKRRCTAIVPCTERHC